MKKVAKPFLTLGLAALLAVTLFTAPVMTAKAASSDSSSETTVVAGSGLTMSTDYPGVSVQAGNSVSFSLDFANGNSAQMVELSSKSSNDAITGYFQGGSNTVSSVYVKNGMNDGLVTYSVTVPDDTKDGTYTIDLTAKGESNTSTLRLTLNVSEVNLGASTMKSDYEEQEGSSSTSFTFNTTITNNALDTQSYSLSADAPDGWTVTFTPSDGSSAVSSIDIDGTSSKTMTVSVKPAEGVTADTYPITINAKSAKENLSEDLTVTITGDYTMTLATQNQTLSFNAKANKATNVVLELTNTGNVAINNINLTASTPTDWTVEFDQSTIDTLAAGDTKTITATVTPSNSAISGDYEVDITAKGDEDSQTTQFRVTVQTQTSWGIIGIIIIVAIILALVGVFKKFGRH